MRKRFRPSPAMVVACIALFVAIGGTTYAATGGNFILGKSNTATSKSTLSAPIADKALTVTNNSSKAGAPDTPAGVVTAEITSAKPKPSSQSSMNGAPP